MVTIAELLKEWRLQAEFDPDYDPWGAKSFVNWAAKHYPGVSIVVRFITEWVPIEYGAWDNGDPRIGLVEESDFVEFSIAEA